MPSCAIISPSSSSTILQCCTGWKLNGLGVLTALSDTLLVLLTQQQDYTVKTWEHKTSMWKWSHINNIFHHKTMIYPNKIKVIDRQWHWRSKWIYCIYCIYSRTSRKNLRPNLDQKVGRTTYAPVGHAWLGRRDRVSLPFSPSGGQRGSCRRPCSR